MIFKVQTVRNSKNYNFDVKKGDILCMALRWHNKFANFHCFSVTIVGK